MVEGSTEPPPSPRSGRDHRHGSAARRGDQHRSPTVDEAYHTTRGLAFWWAGDARLSAAHPPLGNALVALPAALALPKVDFTKEPGWVEANRVKVSRNWFSRDYGPRAER